MPGKYGTFCSDLLVAISDASGLFPWPIPYSESWRKKMMRLERSQAQRSAYHLKDRGLVEEVSKNGKKFLKLTQKGELELLFKKARFKQYTAWDGKWRVVMFDIPEDAKHKRDKLRRLLKAQNFLMIQNSVFISPHPINMEGVMFLKESGLDSYIRIARIDEMDNDADLKIHFKL